MTVPGVYVSTGDGTVNVTVPPVFCVIQTDRPLPPEAWAEVGTLAAEVERTARSIKRHLRTARAAEPVAPGPRTPKAKS